MQIMPSVCVSLRKSPAGETVSVHIDVSARRKNLAGFAGKRYDRQAFNFRCKNNHGRWHLYRLHSQPFRTLDVKRSAAARDTRVGPFSVQGVAVPRLGLFQTVLPLFRSRGS